MNLLRQTVNRPTVASRVRGYESSCGVVSWREWPAGRPPPRQETQEPGQHHPCVQAVHYADGRQRTLVARDQLVHDYALRRRYDGCPI
jgi:hypothetical protein